MAWAQQFVSNPRATTKKGIGIPPKYAGKCSDCIKHFTRPYLMHIASVIDTLKCVIELSRCTMSEK